MQTRLCRAVGQAIADYRLIEEGDKVMVCLSGGKDSYGLLDILLVLQQRAPIRFDLVAVNLDQRQPGFPEAVLPQYLTSRGIPFHIEARDTYSVVKRLIPEGQTTCSLCSRLRRGHLYRIAGELGATKIALGHHRDDIIETLFLNLFYTGKLKAMPPKLRKELAAPGYRKAIELKTGARALRAILEKIMLEVMYDLPQRDDVTEVVIDRAVVEGRKKPALKRPGRPAASKDAS